MNRQQGAPTVGDTVTIVQHVVARSGAVIDARPPADSAIATLVAPPVLTREGDSVRIAYTVAVWTAGHNDLVLPGAIIVDQRGHVDTLPDTHYPLDVASLLPAGKPTNSVPPHAADPWLPRADRSSLPFLVLVPMAIIIIGLLQWRWRRHGPPLSPTALTSTAVPLTDARIAAWLAAGESRLALDHLDALARDRKDLAEWRARAAAVRFTAGEDRLRDALVEEGWARMRPAAE